MLALVPALVATLQVAGAPAQLDTTFAAARGDRLEAHVFAGTITVKGWNRDQVRIQATGLDAGGRAGHGRGGLDLGRSGGTIRVQVQPGRGSGEGDVTVWVPAAMPVELGGNETSIVVEGVQGTVRAIWESLDAGRTAALARGLHYVQIGNEIGRAQLEAIQQTGATDAYEQAGALLKSGRRKAYEVR